MPISWSNQPSPIRTFLLACIFFELLALSGTIVGLGTAARNIMVTLGGFWPDLLSGALPVYPGQSVAMFATSALLHGGPFHLFTNMVGLMWLGPIVTDRVGERAFWPLAGLCAIGAGAVHAALTTSSAPMVGASGVLFGLIGLVGIWAFLDRLQQRRALRPLVEQAVVFAALNIALTLFSDIIAWQAHLGGLLAGAICGVLTWARPVGSRAS